MMLITKNKCNNCGKETAAYRSLKSWIHFDIESSMSITISNRFREFRYDLDFCCIDCFIVFLEDIKKYNT